MSVSDSLERHYRRWLRWYPGWYRREHEDEMLSVLMAGSRPGLERPAAGECWDLVRGGCGTWLRPRVSRSHRAAWLALRLVYVAAMVQCLVGATVFATMPRLHAVLAEHDPGYTAAQWHQEMTGTVRPLAIECGVGVVALLTLGWALGRARRSVRLLGVGGVGALLLFTTVSLGTGLRHGSATDARADLLGGIALWLAESAAVMIGVWTNARRQTERRPQVLQRPATLG